MFPFSSKSIFCFSVYPSYFCEILDNVLSGVVTVWIEVSVDLYERKHFAGRADRFLHFYFILSTCYDRCTDRAAVHQTWPRKHSQRYHQKADLLFDDTFREAAMAMWQTCGAVMPPPLSYQLHFCGTAERCCLLLCCT